MNSQPAKIKYQSDPEPLGTKTTRKSGRPGNGMPNQDGQMKKKKKPVKSISDVQLEVEKLEDIMNNMPPKPRKPRREPSPVPGQGAYLLKKTSDHGPRPGDGNYLLKSQPVPGDGNYLVRNGPSGDGHFVKGHQPGDGSYLVKHHGPVPGDGSYLSKQNQTNGPVPGDGSYLVAEERKPRKQSSHLGKSNSFSFSPNQSPQVKTRGNKPQGFYAGGAFHNSPAPNALPIPSSKQKDGFSTSHESNDMLSQSYDHYGRDPSPQPQSKPVHHATTFDVFNMEDVEDKGQALLQLLKSPQPVSQPRPQEHPLLGLLASASKKPSTPSNAKDETDVAQLTSSLKDVLGLS